MVYKGICCKDVRIVRGKLPDFFATQERSIPSDVCALKKIMAL